MPMQGKSETTLGSGYFDKRITFQSANDTVKTGSGGTNRTWDTVLTTWAHIEPGKGTEVWVAGQVYSTGYTKVLIRFRTDINITPVLRMKYGRKIYNIRSVAVPGEAQTTIQLLVEELQTFGSLR